jgi:succinate-acetate transporter protein
MMAIFSLYCTVCALRINILFVLAFFFLSITFILISSSYWVVVEPGMQQMGHNLMIVSSSIFIPLSVYWLIMFKAGGSFGFVVIPIGWYLLLALMLTTVDFPFNLPVGDLSSVVPSATELRKRKSRSTDVEKGE